MKVLLFHSNLDALREVVGELQKKQVSVLAAQDVDGAWKLLQLHTTSISIAVIHREGTSDPSAEPGTELIARIKSDPVQNELPFILTTSSWSESQCAEHQQGAQGANAYLLTPYLPQALLDLMTAVVGDLQAVSTQTQVEVPQRDEVQVQADVSKLILNSLRVHENSGAQAPQIPQAPKGPMLSLPPHFTSEQTQYTTVGPPGELEIPDSNEPEVGSFTLSGNLASTGMVEHLPELISPEAQIFPSELEIKLETQFKIEPPLSMEPLPDLQIEENFESPLPLQKSEPALASPDIETLKKYLLYREQDLSLAHAQLKAACQQINKLDEQCKAQLQALQNFETLEETYKQRIQDFEQEKTRETADLRAEIDALKFQAKSKTDKIKILETQMKSAVSETERLKDRVKGDIRKIRVREKELENRLEILRRDSEALISARETKIVELKRKLDLLEFNMDLLQDRYNREQYKGAQLRERLAKAAQVVKVVGGVLDDDSDVPLVGRSKHG